MRAELPGHAEVVAYRNHWHEVAELFACQDSRNFRL